MLKSRFAASGVAAALFISLVPAAALGAADSLKITGQHHVTTGQSTTLTVKGHSGVRRGLAIYVDSSPCARKVVKENRRGRSLVVKSVHNDFRQRITFQQSAAGQHYLCAYLYHKDSHGHFVTDRHAGFHYTTS